MSRTAARLDRATWLDTALDALHEEGISGLKVERLAGRLGVTKGSFYHHFADREELLRGVIDRWQSTQEGYVSWLAERDAAASPDKRVERLLEFVKGKDGRHDVGMRAWARINADARRAVEAVDFRRLAYVLRVLEKIGFEGDEAKLRARMIYLYQIGEQTWGLKDPPALRERLYALHVELLAREVSSSASQAVASRS